MLPIGRTTHILTGRVKGVPSGINLHIISVNQIEKY